MAVNTTTQNQVTADFLPSLADTINSLTPIHSKDNAMSTLRSQAVSIPVTAYYLSSKASLREKRAVMMALTLCGRCHDDRASAWQSWVLTWSMLALPELVATLRDDQSTTDYVYESLSQEFVTSCVESIERQLVEETAGEVFITFPPALPNATVVPVDASLVEACSFEGLYCYYAMIVFILGKSLTPENVTALSTKRPSALIRKRGLTTAEPILIGDLKLHPDNYKRVQSGWVRSTRPRSQIIFHLAALVMSGSRGEMLDPVMVNMELLKNAGQSYLFYINELLKACPWCLEIPALRSSYFSYVRMVNVIASQPAYAQPYYKLAMQDAATIVKRRDVNALIGVAIFFAGQTRQNMNQYRIDAGVVQVVRLFQELATQKGFKFATIPDQQLTETSAL